MISTGQEILNFEVEIKVHSKDNEDLTGFKRAKEIQTQINALAGFDFCGSMTNTVTQIRREEPESVTFLYHKKTANFDVFINQLKNKLGIDIVSKCALDD